MLVPGKSPGQRVCASLAAGRRGSSPIGGDIDADEPLASMSADTPVTGKFGAQLDLDRYRALTEVNIEPGVDVE